MRLDKYLKVSRIIKRRTVANEACSMGRVSINDKIAKPATDVNVGDVITVRMGAKKLTAEVLMVKETVRKEEADSMYRIITDSLNDSGEDE
ncbi:MAG: RNA-binding S4 domain-containing protein [Christensenellaceae bacterium]|nr:RNA-binding S4 domain-containing protein [Christensenellaceae bacterium]